jgi:hypothetical protein
MIAQSQRHISNPTKLANDDDRIRIARYTKSIRTILIDQMRRAGLIGGRYGFVGNGTACSVFLRLGKVADPLRDGLDCRDDVLDCDKDKEAERNNCADHNRKLLLFFIVALLQRQLLLLSVDSSISSSKSIQLGRY